MNNRMMLIAAGLTAFVLVLVGGLAARLTQPAPVATTNTDVTAVVAEVAPGSLDPTTEALIRERDAAYQAALADANARLETANAQITQANEQLTQQANQVPVQAQAQAAMQGPAAAQVAGPAVSGEPISSEQAVQVATAYIGGGTVVDVDLERERNISAYEVKFSDGSEVYVDAADGRVVYAEIGGEDHEHDD